MRGDLHEHRIRPAFCVFNKHVEVTIVIEQARIQELELWVIGAAPAVFLEELGVGESGLRILVEHLQIGVRGRGVEVIVQLLDVFAVIAFGVGQPEQPFLEDRVLAVPQRQRQAEGIAVVVAESGDAVLAPTIGAAARVVVRQINPRTSRGAGAKSSRTVSH